jgi:hypothetical protein
VLYNIAKELSIPLPNEEDHNGIDNVPVTVLQVGEHFAQFRFEISDLKRSR